MCHRAAKPVCHNCGACAPEPVLRNKRSHPREKPAHHEWRVAPTRCNSRKLAHGNQTQHSQNQPTNKRKTQAPNLFVNCWIYSILKSELRSIRSVCMVDGICDLVFGYLLWTADSGKGPDAGKECRQEEKEITEDEMVGWHHRLDGRELGPNLGDGEEQGSLGCCRPWGCEESDATWQLNNNIHYENGFSTPAP